MIMIERDRLLALLSGEIDGHNLGGGHMLQVVWSRKTDKRKRNPETGQMETLERQGDLITRRLILRSDWSQPTPSGSFVPKGGNMFNVATPEEAQRIREERNLKLFMSLEGVTHPHGEADHPVNVPLDNVVAIRDCHADETFIVV